jgi:hypothetical protein
MRRQPVIHQFRRLIAGGRVGEFPTAGLLPLHALERPAELSRPLPGQVTAKFPSAQDLGVSTSLYQTAQNAYQHLLPNGGSAPNQT